MQRKKMSIISVSERHSRICCIKYSLMACNAFGIMLGIFVVLFGISYPKEDFPGGYSGKTTAGISGVFILFTGIGYCGAHHQKTYFLLLYAAVILLFLGSNIAIAFLLPTRTLMDPYGKPFYVVSSLLLIVMSLAILLAWQLCTQRKRSRRDRRRSSSTRANGFNSSSHHQGNNNNNLNNTTSLQGNNNNSNANVPNMSNGTVSSCPSGNLISADNRAPSLAAHFGQTCAQPDNEHGFSTNGPSVLVKANLHPPVMPNNSFVNISQAPLHRYTNNNGFVPYSSTPDPASSVLMPPQ